MGNSYASMQAPLSDVCLPNDFFVLIMYVTMSKNYQYVDTFCKMEQSVNMGGLFCSFPLFPSLLVQVHGPTCWWTVRVPAGRLWAIGARPPRLSKKGEKNSPPGSTEKWESLKNWLANWLPHFIFSLSLSLILFGVWGPFVPVIQLRE